MKMEDMVLASVDDHIVEPPDVFENHVPAKYKDRAPHVIRNGEGRDVWVIEGEEKGFGGMGAAAGRVMEERGNQGYLYEHLRKGCYDIDARIEDMNVNGLMSSLNFGSLPGFCGELFFKMEDKDFALVLVKAYNDWHIDEWCGAHPDRFIPQTIIPMWDAKLAAEEVARCAKKGSHAVTFSDNPHFHGFPSLHQDYWDPFWKACCDNKVTINLHIGSGQELKFPSPETPIDAAIITMPMSLVACAADLTYSPVLRKFPDIQFALSEGGIGWIPYFMERADYTYEMHHRWTRQDFGGTKPSELFRDHVATCFIDDKAGIMMRELIGIDNITFEVDYPHTDAQWPNSPEVLWESLTGCSDEDINKITHLNAMRLYNFDPFTKRKKEECTVAALRKEATHVNTTFISVGDMPPSEKSSGPITRDDIEKQLELSPLHQNN